MRVEAEVVTVHRAQTAKGQRLYVVFETPDRRRHGLWTSAEQLNFTRVAAGDKLQLEQDHTGSFYPIVRNSGLTKLFASLKDLLAAR
ncbi:MAG: hypothetical protein F6J97_02170 [Leptolyngbya sp. SIO4C1]|nr:hypothetical protein [Leptolyngbya sp. SIO4C1]